MAPPIKWEKERLLIYQEDRTSARYQHGLDTSFQTNEVLVLHLLLIISDEN